MKNKVNLEKIAAVALALGIWQFGAMALDKSILLVSPLDVAALLTKLVGEIEFWQTVGYSFSRITAGFALGLLSGTVFAVTAHRLPIFEILLWPFIAAIKATPVASFIILCLIWLNSSALSIIISFLMVLPIVYTNMLQGLKSTDFKLLQMADLFKASWPRKLIYIFLPQLKPYLLSACSVSLGMSWKAGVAAEVIGIPDGSIGEMLYEAKVYLSSADLFAWTVVIVIISIIFEKLFNHLLKSAFNRLERI